MAGVMNVASSNATPKPLSERQRAALVTLLGDEDPRVFAAIREHVLAQGPAAVDWLRPHLISRDPVLRKRARALANELARRNADDRFLQFCLRCGENLDLEQGALLLAQTRDPDLNPEGYEALLESYAATLRERIKPRSHARTRLHLLNAFFQNDLTLLCSPEFALWPNANYLNRVLDTSVASPLAGGLLYLILGRRLGLPLTGIWLPDLFLCRFQSSTAEFFIDVSGDGALLSRATAVRMVRSRIPGSREADLKPATERQLLAALCAQLYAAHASEGEPEEAARLRRYQLALERPRGA